jgi:hypothetical protein
MRLRTPIVCLATLALASLAAFAAAKPNFTGSWELDQSKSHSIPPTMKQWLTVVHAGDKLTVETKISDARGERTQKDEYTLDGKESEFAPTPPPNAPAGTPPPKGKRKSSWMPGDRGVLIEEEIQTTTPDGPATIIVARKWMMWPDGTMSIEIIQETPRGTFNSKRVFVKK